MGYRSIVELIQELEQEASNFNSLALVVKVESNALFVFADNLDRLSFLNELMWKKEGLPIGFLGFRLRNGAVSISYRSLKEYRGEQWPTDYLKGLTETIRELLKAKGIIC